MLSRFTFNLMSRKEIRAAGFEPATPRFQAECSSQAELRSVMPPLGLEPSCSEDRGFTVPDGYLTVNVGVNEIKIA